jgi:leucyl-tRNA synthetase
MEYKPQEIEPKWQKYWQDHKLFKAEDFSKKPKKYFMVEFPYPSGAGLHVGHARSYAALDASARKSRMEGNNVLFPMGWDAFGLPTENYAIKNGIHPAQATEKNIANFKKQMKSLGLSFDWSREINTTDPKYFKWTQWIFLKLFERGLAYQAEIPVNWCPSCKIGLANEEAVGGKCERCGAQVEQKNLKQWMIKITEYADRLIGDLDKVDFLDKIKAQQINWIGKSSGTEICFKVKDSPEVIKVFTTRADTLFGVTAVVLAPENPLSASLVAKEQKDSVDQYIREAKKKNEFERENMEKEKTGVFTGSFCINPINGSLVPVWVGDYVVSSYGGGAVMMVPAHDYRDYDFAQKYKLDIKEVVSGGDISKEAFVGYGKLVNSGDFTGLSSEEAIEGITEWLGNNKLGAKAIKYKLRDWVFSRQHYWGEPIPIIHCKKCGTVPVPEKELPIELPYIEKYQPTGTGESPLAAISDWVNVKCPKCGGPAKRETDTMPNWAGSNWYFMRYCDPNNDKVLADPKKLKYWLPVDWYNGGMEHTTLHLLYSRFIYKFLYDIGAAPTPEPYQKRTSHGMVLAEDNRKMSKSFGNVINPDDIVRDYGADALRVYEMFIGPFDQAIAWNTNGLKGCYKFLERVYVRAKEGRESVPDAESDENKKKLNRLINKTIKRVSQDADNLKFNTAMSALMIFMNESSGLHLQNPKEEKEIFSKFLIILSPFAPHLAEELWWEIGHKDSILKEKWPQYDPGMIEEERVRIMIQVNGKVRGEIETEANIQEDKVKELAISDEKVKNWIIGKDIKKVIFIPNKLINIVI